MIKPHKREKGTMVEKNIFKISKRVWTENRARNKKHRRNLWELFLVILVQIQINYDWYNNIDKFQIGDRVKRNWKAKVYLKSILSDHFDSRTFVIERFFCKGENWEGRDEDTRTDKQSTSVFWIKRI